MEVSYIFELAASYPTMPEGICKLCNKFDQLTYEHVPPRVTFNKNTRFKSIDYMDYVKERNPLEAKFKGKTEQGGLGYYSLCKQCNSFLGTTYVTDFQKYSNSFIQFAKKEDLNYFELIMHDFHALNVLKQIVSMFLSINHEEFSKNNRDLAEFVLDPKSNEFPQKFRVFNYLNTEGQLRNLPIMVVGDLNAKASILGTEIAFPPLGHVLTIDFNGKLPLHQEITFFKNFRYDEGATLDLKVYRLPTYMPFLLDYRDKATINKTINESS